MAFSWVSNKLRDTKDYMVDKIENTSGYISREGSRVFNGITGKATFQEAEKLYKKIEEEYRENASFEVNFPDAALLKVNTFSFTSSLATEFKP